MSGKRANKLVQDLKKMERKKPVCNLPRAERVTNDNDSDQNKHAKQIETI